MGIIAALTMLFRDPKEKQDKEEIKATRVDQVLQAPVYLFLML